MIGFTGNIGMLYDVIGGDNATNKPDVNCKSNQSMSETNIGGDRTTTMSSIPLLSDSALYSQTDSVSKTPLTMETSLGLTPTKQHPTSVSEETQRNGAGSAVDLHTTLATVLPYSLITISLSTKADYDSSISIEGSPSEGAPEATQSPSLHSQSTQAPMQSSISAGEVN